jgi:nitrate/nitrite transporter NarK
VWWRVFRDRPEDHPAVNAAELGVIAAGSVPDITAATRTTAFDAAETIRLRQTHRVPWRQIFANRTLLALCAMYGAAIYGWYFYLTWLPTYLLRARGWDLHEAGALAALPLLAIGVGVAAGGWLSDTLTARWGARAGRRLPGVVGLPLAAVAVVTAVLTPSPLAAALLLAAAAGLAALGVAPAWAVCLEIGGAHAGVVSGAMNTIGNLGGTLSPVVVGIALERWSSWRLPLFSVAVLYVVAGLCWLAIDPTRRVEPART